MGEMDNVAAGQHQAPNSKITGIYQLVFSMGQGTVL